MAITTKGITLLAYFTSWCPTPYIPPLSSPEAVSLCKAHNKSYLGSGDNIRPNNHPPPLILPLKLILHYNIQYIYYDIYTLYYDIFNSNKLFIIYEFKYLGNTLQCQSPRPPR